MGFLTKIQAYDAGQEIVDTFYGLNRAEKIREGEWSDERNLTSDRYPMLSVRAKRSAAATYDGYICSTLAKEKLAVLTLPNSHIESESAMSQDSDHVLSCNLYYGGVYKDFFQFVYPSYFPGRMISFGAYIVVTGINAWYNTATGEKGYMDIEFTPAECENDDDVCVRFYPVDEDGNKLTINARLTKEKGAQQEAQNPQTYTNGQCYAVTDERLIRQFVTDTNGDYWRTVPCAVRAESDGIETGQVFGNALMPADPFRVGDMVEITGNWSITPIVKKEFQGTKKVREVGEDYIILEDVFIPYTVRSILWSTISAEGNHAVIARHTPDMDYVIECQNRLWGCKYGTVDGKLVNEIYASELGNFTSWRNYDGTSMASYAASCGTDGPWTGAISYQGKPHFFKEKHVHKVYIAASGAHQIVETPILGVQQHCDLSLCVLDGTMFYMSRDGVCAYDGSTPTVISKALGNLVCEDASFGGARKKLFANIVEDNGNGTMTPKVYTYDLQRGIWHEEHFADLGILLSFAVIGDHLYACDAGLGHYRPLGGAGISTTLWDLHGLEGAQEGDVYYSCTTGLIGWANVEQKYISRFDMRLTLPEGATMKVEIEYDSSGEWEEQGVAEGGGTGSIMIPVRPRRCDHFRIRLSGKGEMRMYSFAKRLLKGSDVV